ncbi:DNA-binding transcriptional activator HyfR [Andreprevotia sp. IGB-42]|uniref:sigma-54 interaction domain-containing protein n=1 Tax=Andreprevotia sp. IGB-42 TaxID=2497473 RepID=UPI001356E24D|nr:sigma-54 dependent transcriptional regulator [Andreprevotia sp. IGB-42]KAF0815324.1 DNA-binding transcriptional activator HyfR [Andreprevotia sp. IGB-42]
MNARYHPSANHYRAQHDDDEAPVITLPNSQALATSIRATAQVFEDPKSVALLGRIRQVAPSEANVLIIGETGTGKELIARHVHALSHRGNAPFVAVNCGAFSESLVESELFGHEKGAFTGAFSAKPGWFEAANGGTLFLDEIGDLPMSIQVKLLRVLQEREVVRLGSRKPIPIDVRVIAATNVRLEEAVAAGHFREDLFYRLRVVNLELPALRDRPGDILPLAHYFVDEYRRRLGYGNVSIAADAEHKLHAHAWPGNIRELENVIHHALLICRNQTLRGDDLHLSSLQLSRRAGSASPAVPLDAAAQLEQALTALFEENHDALFEHIEEVVMRAAYAYCHRNQVQAAKLLGISRNIIRARLIKIGEVSALR